MTCEEFDNLLHPFVDGEFDSEERHEAEAHVLGCPRCAQKVQSERAFKQALRDAANHDFGTARAPDALRSRIQLSIRQHDRHRALSRAASVAAAAAVVVALGGVGFAWWPKARDRFMLDAAKHHARPLPSEVADAQHDAVEAWFGGKLDHRVPVPRFPNAAIAGARISNVEDRPAAYIKYKKPDRTGNPRTIGLFVFGDQDNEVGAEPLPSVEMEQRLGYNVALWRDGEIVYELVSDLDENDIREMLQAQERGGPPQLPANAPSVAHPSQLPQVDVRPASLQQ